MLKKSFKIDLNIYEKENILSGIEDFKENDFDIKLEDDTLVIAGENEEEIKDIFNELMNYILVL